MDFKERILELDSEKKILEQKKREDEECERLALVKKVTDELSTLFDPEIQRALTEIDLRLHPFKKRLESLGLFEILKRLETELDLKDPRHKMGILIYGPTMPEIDEHNLVDHFNNLKSRSIRWRVEETSKLPEQQKKSSDLKKIPTTEVEKLRHFFFGVDIPPSAVKTKTSTPKFEYLDELKGIAKETMQLKFNARLEWDRHTEQVENNDDIRVGNPGTHPVEFFNYISLTYSTNLMITDHYELTIAAGKTSIRVPMGYGEKFDASRLTRNELDDILSRTFFYNFGQNFFSPAPSSRGGLFWGF